ncbi:MAG: hypothetical protein KDA32_07420 [Phycisphaerales bacterium]|nr:hypothetical protein [Phycisphaerales bacterium]
MATIETAPQLDRIPESGRESFGDFAGVLHRLAGDNLLSLSAFGGWLSGDPFFAGAPARSVAVFQRVELDLLDRLASAGTRLGQARLAAPLTMTPEHIRASMDVFPLEFLEIQRLHVCVLGEDYFSELALTPADVRLQCERELKGVLVQLRQGLLAAAGERSVLIEIARGALGTLNRVLLGLAWLRDPTSQVIALHDLVSGAERSCGVSVAGIRAVLDGAPGLTFDLFSRFYADFDVLANRVDQQA